MTRLLLVGGGHSHVQVLLGLAARRAADLQVTVVSRDILTPYSGMLPGVVAGHYEPADALIDLAPLCEAAGAELLQAEVDRLDPAAGTAGTGDGRSWGYDLVSINCGSAPGLGPIPSATEIGVAVKPISGFLSRWEHLLAHLRERRGDTFRLVVVGAGAGGVEMALALNYRLREREACRGLQVSLIDAAESILPGHDPGLARRLDAILARQGVDFRGGTRIAEALSDGLIMDTGDIIAADEVLWVTDAGAQPWPGEAGLAVDRRGFIRVDAGLRSLSHPNVFATGDIVSFAPEALPKAGVYAVRQGPLLADNLLRAAAGRPLRDYRPQRHYLVLISTGARYAVAARGRWTAEGAWAWRWKDWIDRRFIRRFRRH